MTISSADEEKKLTLTFRESQDVEIVLMTSDYVKNLDFVGCCGDPESRKCKK